MTWEEAVLHLKSQPAHARLVRACNFDDPLVHAAHRFSVSDEWREVVKILRPWMPGKVLDLGAGNGISAYAFATTGCEVTALEPDPSAVVGADAIRQLASDAQVPISVNQAFGERLPYPDGAFDIFYGRQVLHHASDLNKLCAEAARVLRPGGAFLATREHVIATQDDLEPFLSAHPLHHLYGSENAYLLDEYTTALSDADFNLLRVIGPFDSVINYFPASRRDILDAAVRGYVEKLGTPRFATLLRPAVSALCAISRAMASHILALHNERGYYPGICYSFLACKPS